MPAEAGIARLIDASAILSAEQQAFVAARHAEDTWSLDPAAGTVTLTAPDGATTVCRAHFLGTSAPGPNTWLWGWQNVNGFPPAFIALAEQVRGAGERQGVAELTTAELTLTDGLPRRLTIAAKTVTGIAAHYSGPIGGGSRAWLLLEHPDLVLPPPSVQETMTAIRAAVESVEIADHRAAVRSWAAQRGATARQVSGGSALRLGLSDGSLLVVFDERGRIGRVETEAPDRTDASRAEQDESSPAPPPAPVPAEPPTAAARPGPVAAADHAAGAAFRVEAAPGPVREEAPEPARRPEAETVQAAEPAPSRPATAPLPPREPEPITASGQAEPASAFPAPASPFPAPEAATADAEAPTPRTGDGDAPSDHDRLLAMFEPAHAAQPDGDGAAHEADVQPESPVRRFWDFLRGPRP